MANDNGNGNGSRLFGVLQQALFLAVGAIGALVISGQRALDADVGRALGGYDLRLRGHDQDIRELVAGQKLYDFRVAELSKTVDQLSDQVRGLSDSTREDDEQVMRFATDGLTEIRDRLDSVRDEVRDMRRTSGKESP